MQSHQDQNQDPGRDQFRRTRQKKKAHLMPRILIAAAAVLLLVFGIYRLWERPPEMKPPEVPDVSTVETPEPAVSADPSAPSPEPTLEPLPDGTPLQTARQNGVYTILLAGLDEASENTDTILLCRFDTVNHAINCVSIPRDTLINVDWDVRRINSVYAGGKRGGGNGIENLLMHIRFLTGIEPDAYAVISLDTFVRIIDILGGVWFYVPIQMDYEQYYDNLFIHLQPGYQYLDGYQCMGLCRFRSDYANGDLGRIEMQHAFFKAVIEQFLTLGNLPHARRIFQILAEGLDTNLTAANIAWFVRQAMQCDKDNIRFFTMPGYGKAIQNFSYYVISPYQWLEMINSALNPYETPVGYGNLNIVYEEDGVFSSTTAVQGPWYYE